MIWRTTKDKRLGIQMFREISFVPFCSANIRHENAMKFKQ